MEALRPKRGADKVEVLMDVASASPPVIARRLLALAVKLGGEAAAAEIRKKASGIENEELRTVFSQAGKPDE